MRMFRLNPTESNRDKSFKRHNSLLGRFRRHKQFNESSHAALNRTCLASDTIAFVVFCRLCYRLTLRDPSEILLLRGFTVSHKTVREREAKQLPIMGDALRKGRHGTRRRSGRSWYVDETYLKVEERWCYLYRVIDRDGNLVDTMRGFKNRAATGHFCREHDELRSFLRPRFRHHQHATASRRRSRFLRNAHIALTILQSGRGRSPAPVLNLCICWWTARG
jgi:DDE domain